MKKTIIDVVCLFLFLLTNAVANEALDIANNEVLLRDSFAGLFPVFKGKSKNISAQFNSGMIPSLYKCLEYNNRYVAAHLILTTHNKDALLSLNGYNGLRLKFKKGTNFIEEDSENRMQLKRWWGKYFKQRGIKMDNRVQNSKKSF